ncbi:MAG: hypothetical protein LIP16_16285 [Clostridium sp.]|nr:hypothetical protein [Clostridium sp.]
MEKAEHSLNGICQLKGGREECGSLLAEMQNCAIEMGEAIEDAEGEGTTSVALLEQYCELLWECLNAAPGPVRQRILKEIYRKRSAAKKQIQNEFSEVSEILFLPYKASMWDSMESIYKFFSGQENCQCTVMPIPYYSKHTDGSLGEEYYEGELYPDDVLVTHYKDYDMAEHCPEVIIIHNPYDDMNYVTSVHPDFYARNLKQYTDCLVYVSYFIINSAISNISLQFCQTPGALLSDLVIVQSESVRETYIKAIEEWVGFMGRKGAFSRSALERKIQALGSPKVDKVLHSKREDFALPEQWNSMLKGKRAVLYNTSVTGILQKGELELNKIEDVIEIFQRREDAVLWWRPHPLSDTTFASMRPELRERYLKIVKSFKEEERGIYDDTPDLHRAIAWTDFYYGDSSSLTILYGLTGKPVVMQNKTVLSRNAHSDLSVLYVASAEENGEIWFTARNFNGFFHMNCDLGLTDYLGSVPGEKCKVYNLFTDIVKDGDNLWLIPGRGEALVKYSINENTFIRYRLPDNDELQAGDVKFCSAWLDDDKLYFIPSEQSYFANFDLKTESWSIDNSWKKRLENKYGIKLNAPYFYDFCILKQAKLALIPIHGTNIIIEYSIQTGKMKYRRLGANDNSFSFIDGNEDAVYLVARNRTGTIYRWKLDGIKIELAESHPECFSEGLCAGFCVVGETAYMAPSVGKGALKVDLASGSSEVLKPDAGDVFQFYSVKKLSGGKIQIPAACTGGNDVRTMIVNTESGIDYTVVPKRPEHSLLEQGNPFEQITGRSIPSKPSGHIIWETREITLEQILNWPDNIVSLHTAEIYKSLFANGSGDCGEKTAKFIMEYINES